MTKDDITLLPRGIVPHDLIEVRWVCIVNKFKIRLISKDQTNTKTSSNTRETPFQPPDVSHATCTVTPQPEDKRNNLLKKPLATSFQYIFKTAIQQQIWARTHIKVIARWVIPREKSEEKIVFFFVLLT